MKNLLVLPNTSEENAFLFGERFRREVEKMEFIPAGEEEAHKVTISGGISTYPCMPDVDEDANTVKDMQSTHFTTLNTEERTK